MSAVTVPWQDEIDAYAVSDQANEEWGEVHLDGVPIPVLGSVDTTNLAVMQAKFTIGEPNKDSDNMMSVWSQEDWTGGGQVADLNELSDAQRFRHGTIETRYPRIITLPPETTSYGVAASTGTVQPVGDFLIGATKLFFAAFGLDLRHWDKGTSTFVHNVTLTAEPVNKALVYDGLLWIPQGANGYDTWDGAAGAVTHYTDSLSVAMTEWDDKIISLGSTGQISIWDGTAWNHDPALRMRGDRTMRNLVTWWDPNREPAVFIVTDRDLWVIDPIVPRLYKTGLHFPRHPDQGLGSCAWRDDAMYVSVGTGVHQLSLGGVISAMGLDRNDGLPSYLRGAIVDLDGDEYNSMLALVKGIGSTVIDTTTLAPSIEETMLFDTPLIAPVSQTSARASLQRWTGTGWHTAWESPDASGTPSRLRVSEADDEYCIWWGYGAKMFRQLLHRSYHNPRQGAELGTDRFAPSAYLYTGRFDANMAMFLKLASHLDVHLDPLSTQDVTIAYQTDETYPNWITLGSVSAPGQNVLSFDPNGDGFAEGLGFRWIEFRYDLSTSDPAQTPIVMWLALKFIKLPLQTRSWTFQVPLRHDEQWKGLGPRELADFLDGLATAKRFFTFKHQDRTYRVREAQVRGPEPTGQDRRGLRNVALVELDPSSEIVVNAQ
jgi:hypothetical protein